MVVVFCLLHHAFLQAAGAEIKPYWPKLFGLCVFLSRPLFIHVAQLAQGQDIGKLLISSALCPDVPKRERTFKENLGKTAPRSALCALPLFLRITVGMQQGAGLCAACVLARPRAYCRELCLFARVAAARP